MAEQHRATSEEWARVKARPAGVAFYSCLLELRDRIEALEAPQSGSIDLSHLSDAEREKILKMLVNPGRFEVLEVAQPAKPNHPEIPDSSLKERIKSCMIEGVGSTWETTAASVLTEVAGWLDTVQKFDAAVLLRLEAER